ncbi:hypothetical protein SMDB11_3460A [Serratia marcescens subsp. marcescens Db11]|uniref:Uncharacterized protein n=1 Tax=Serratia marcescens subsp. marcescens Db11 TaxID=273526 RepID=A0ABC9IMQ8_SERMA|nr:hypothetical protein SMDB11_3460A [Serratia marcescens subsp. marcescens Db11]
MVLAGHFSVLIPPVSLFSSPCGTYYKRPLTWRKRVKTTLEIH